MRKRPRAASERMRPRPKRAPRPQDPLLPTGVRARPEAHGPTQGQAVAAPVLEQSALAMAANRFRGDPFVERGMRKVLAHAEASLSPNGQANAPRELSAKGKPRRIGTWITVLPQADPPRAQGAKDRGPRTGPAEMPDHGVPRQAANGARRRIAERTRSPLWTAWCA